MQNETQDYVAALRKVKEKPLRNPSDLQVRKDELLSLIDRIYGPGSDKKKRVRKINHRRRVGSGSVNRMTGETSGFAVNDNFDSCKNRVHGLIDTCVEDLEKFGPPKKRSGEAAEDAPADITVTQNQTVNVNAVLEALQQELAEDQIRELKEILSEEEASEEKREKLTNKIKSFGSDVAANTLASIFTNPQILGLF